MPSSHEAVLARIQGLYKMLFEHSGYGEMGIEIRYLRKHEKEVLIRCGRQYRFVVPCDCPFGDTGRQRLEEEGSSRDSVQQNDASSKKTDGREPA